MRVEIVLNCALLWKSMSKYASDYHNDSYNQCTDSRLNLCSVISGLGYIAVRKLLIRNNTRRGFIPIHL